MLLFSLSFALSVGAQEVGLIFPWWILSALGWDVAIDCVGKLCKTRLLGRSWSCWLLHTFALEWNKCKSESQKLGGWPFFSNSISWYFMFSAVVAPSLYSGLHLHPWTWGSIVWSRRQRISRFFRSDPMSFFALRGKEVPFIPGEDLLRSLLGISLTQR